MAKVTLVARVHVSWWLPLYLAGVRITAIFTGCELDWQKVHRYIERGATVRLAVSPPGSS